jgi:hypothetical protein
MRPLVAHCHLGLGALGGPDGGTRPAGEHLATAVALDREMGMPFWRERAETELARRGG